MKYRIQTFVMENDAEFELPDGERVIKVLDHSAVRTEITYLDNGETENKMRYTITVLIGPNW